MVTRDANKVQLDFRKDDFHMEIQRRFFGGSGII